MRLYFALRPLRQVNLPAFHVLGQTVQPGKQSRDRDVSSQQRGAQLRQIAEFTYFTSGLEHRTSQRPANGRNGAAQGREELQLTLAWVAL